MVLLLESPIWLQWLGGHPATIVAMLALALACGLLSLIVLWRRWAFLGEGVAHAGFGGAGTAWLLAAFFPALDRTGLVDLFVINFCVLTALGIGFVHRSGKVHPDTAIGAFLAGTMAWGFLGQQVYLNAYHRSPAGFQSLLFGQAQLLSWTHAQLAVAMLIVCLSMLTMFRKEALLYCFDPDLARTSGVRASLVHFMLILLITLAIVSGVGLIGTVLTTAMLNLTAATAVQITRKLYPAALISCTLSVVAAIAGLTISTRWPALPEGPLIVLWLFVTFLLTWAVRHGRRE